MTTRQQVTYGVDFFEMDQSAQSCTPIHVKTVRSDTNDAGQKKNIYIYPCVIKQWLT